MGRTFRIGSAALILAIGLPYGAVWAQEDEGTPFSARVGIESGIFQPAHDALHPYLYSHLELETHPGIADGLSLDLEGQANGQEADVPMGPSEPEAPRKNYLNLQWVSTEEDASQERYQLELDQAAFHWASGPLEMRAGLFKPDWGYSTFYRPTDYFFPIPPLSWLRDLPSASEGADASCFLFDDLSVEGAARFLEGGDAEWVARLAQKGIGLTVTPSFARLAGKDGFGWEVMGTFPTAQVRFEGVEWFNSLGGRFTDINIGASTSRYGVKYSLEIFRDGMGEIFRSGSGFSAGAYYVFISAEGTLTKEWKLSTAVVASFDGGPVLFRPKLNWTFEERWEAGFQAQVPLGDWAGPLQSVPSRVGLSIDHSL